jgi:hypothetical protein
VGTAQLAAGLECQTDNGMQFKTSDFCTLSSGWEKSLQPALFKWVMAIRLQCVPYEYILSACESTHPLMKHHRKLPKTYNPKELLKMLLLTVFRYGASRLKRQGAIVVQGLASCSVGFWSPRGISRTTTSDQSSPRVSDVVKKDAQMVNRVDMCISKFWIEERSISCCYTSLLQCQPYAVQLCKITSSNLP